MKTKLFILAFFTFTFFTAKCGFAQTQINQSLITSDVNKDGIVNGADLMLLIGNYNVTCTSGQNCPTDINKDGVTNGADLMLVIGYYNQRCNVMIFDVSNAVYTPGFVDVPVSISSDEIVYGIDFHFLINQTKLSYHSIIEYPNIPTLQYAAYQSPIDNYLRFSGFTAGIGASDFLPNDIKIISVRFSTIFGTVNTSDIYNFMSLIDGKQVGYIIK